MPRKRRKSASALPSGLPKSPRVLLDPKAYSPAADLGAPDTTGGPRNGGASTQAHHPPQSPSPTAPPTLQRQVRSIPLAAASPRPLPQSASPGPAAWAPASDHHHGSVGPSSGPPPPPTVVATVSVPQTPRQQAAAHGRTPWSPKDGYCSSSTPSPARAGTPSPPPNSRSSSASSSGPTSCDSNPSTVRSYADVIKGPANQDPYAKLSWRFLNFLKDKCTSYSETTAYDKGPIISTSEAGSFNLKILFEHILEYNEELAYAIFYCHDRFNEWVYPTLSQFLIREGIVKNVVLRMKFTFYTMPPSTKPLSDFLREHWPLVSNKLIFGRSFKVHVARDAGIMLVHGFLVEIFDSHAKGLTWNGGFSITDMVVINCMKCSITKMSVRGGSHCRAKDLHKIGEIFMPMFDDNGEMALYFDELKKDLSRASENEVKEEWYREYLLSHPALKPSIPRYNLECGLQHAVISFRAKCSLIRSVLGDYSSWKTLIPNDRTQNTLAARSLYEVFWYKGKHIEDPFPATVGGLLAYKRNFLQHGHDYVKVEDHTELEQFAAKTFSQALPNILRRLLRDCKMHMNGPFTVHWEAYRASRVGNDGNSEGRTGICVAFCEEGYGNDSRVSGGQV